MTRHALAVLTALAALSPTVAPALAGDSAEAHPGTLNLVFENDRVANTDRHYTHGSYLSYVGGHNDVPGWVHALGDGLPLLEGPVTRVGVLAGQTMFTPNDISRSDVIEDDRPYAGYLYGGAKLYSEQLGSDGPGPDTGVDGLQVWELNVGVIGEESLADETQNFVHNLIEVQRANGWDNQLASEPAVNLYYRRNWRFIGDLDDMGHQAAVVPHVNAALGNVYTYGATGASIVFGRNLRANWGPARISPRLQGNDFFDVDRGDVGSDWHWSVFLGAEARAVAHNIFLDGSTFEDSHSVSKRPLVGELQAGITVAWKSYQLGFTQVFRTREFDEQDEADVFGAVTLAVNF